LTGAARDGNLPGLIRGETMGLGDNRRSPKMRRKIRQRKLKQRIKNRRTRNAEARATAKGASKPAKKSK
jgi:hypothetical protein